MSAISRGKPRSEGVSFGVGWVGGADVLAS